MFEDNNLKIDFILVWPYPNLKEMEGKELHPKIDNVLPNTQTGRLIHFDLHFVDVTLGNNPRWDSDAFCYKTGDVALHYSWISA